MMQNRLSLPPTKLFTSFCCGLLLSAIFVTTGKIGMTQGQDQPQSESKMDKLPEVGKPLTDDQAVRLASLALEGMDQQYPNKPSNVMAGPEGVRSPKEMHPAFYGCFDWHSSVHGHWKLVRLLKTQPDFSIADHVRQKLDAHLTKANIEAELAYFQEKENKSFERMYGWAWYFRLVQELHEWDDPQGKTWRENLRPLEDHLVAATMDYLPKLTYPIRTGVHPNTAFALGQARDYAVAVDNQTLVELIDKRSKEYFLNDKNYPAAYEPSGEDFFSAALNEADLMRRVLDKQEFSDWLQDFLPQANQQELKNLFQPVSVSDITDGKLVHLAGLNLNRAWTLRGIASTLDPADPQYEVFQQAAKDHTKVGLSYVFTGDYAGEHWLGTFAVYVLTNSGL